MLMDMATETAEPTMPSRGRFQKIVAFFRRYERHLSSLALVVGFIIDNLTLKRIDLLFENLVLSGYLCIAGTSILLINLSEGAWIRGRIAGYIKAFAPVVMQFAFGALFSGFVVFYSRSASLAASWPFMLVLVGILIGNESFRRYYVRLTFQISIFFLALFSFSIFYIPIIVGMMNAWMFLLSGAVSIVALSLFLALLWKIVPMRAIESRNPIFWSIAGIFLLINVFYFLNILPPIPLSLKEAGVYHDVVRVGDSYRLTSEDRPWYERFLPHETITLAPGNPAYVFTSVFAPTKLSTNTVHEWQYYDASEEAWKIASRIQFLVQGGRDGGYRGYSMKVNVWPGKWRVDVETERGQLIGRIRFNIEESAESPNVEEVVR